MTTLRILITGSRLWTDATTIGNALTAAIDQTDATEITIVHGACPRGADQLAAEFCASEAAWFDNAGRQLTEERHPAAWNRHGRRAGFIRNQAMVDAGADLCLAFIVDHSPGATHCVDRARQAGIPVRVHRATTGRPATRCPSCSGTKASGQYLCRTCWFTLTAAARRALNRRDSRAGLRRLELHRQLRDDVLLPEIRITP